MELVHFGEDVAALAPEALGTLLTVSDRKWVGWAEVAAAARRGEVVCIRPATAGEVQRAQGVAALLTIAHHIGKATANLLETGDTFSAALEMTGMRDDIETFVAMKAPVSILAGMEG